MKVAASGKRGVFWRANPRGSQEVRHRDGRRVRGAWWIRWYCTLGHKHYELSGPKSIAQKNVESRRTEARTGFCERQQPTSRPMLFQDAAKEYGEWSKAHKRSWRTDQHWLNRLKSVFSGKT